MAGQLLTEREDALRELGKIDAELQRELENAKKANNDADTFALAATLAGAGATILSASEPNTAKPKSDDGKTKEAPKPSSQIKSPSAPIVEMISIRVKTERRVIESDGSVGAYIQRENKTVYVRLRWKTVPCSASFVHPGVRSVKFAVAIRGGGGRA